MSEQRYSVCGCQLVAMVKGLIREGNIRRIRIIHKGRTALEIPLTIGASATALLMLAAPALVALGALAVLITECTVIVEKIDEEIQ